MATAAAKGNVNVLFDTANTAIAVISIVPVCQNSGITVTCGPLPANTVVTTVSYIAIMATTTFINSYFHLNIIAK